MLPWIIVEQTVMKSGGTSSIRHIASLSFFGADEREGSWWEQYVCCRHSCQIPLRGLLTSGSDLEAVGFAWAFEMEPYESHSIKQCRQFISPESCLRGWVWVRENNRFTLWWFSKISYISLYRDNIIIAGKPKCPPSILPQKFKHSSAALHQPHAESNYAAAGITLLVTV
jgi:hypothetical protein